MNTWSRSAYDDWEYLEDSAGNAGDRRDSAIYAEPYALAEVA